jgi:4-amino-4-deoxy-L-arabinose transferase-like glycosyltransferase
MLAVIVASAAIVRLLYLWYFTGAIDWEGAEYVRNAQNLAAGRGPIGIDLPGSNVVFPLLFPIVIAAASWFTNDFELTARLISVAAGVALIVPIFYITQLVYNQRTAFLAATLAAAHPLLIGFSAQACSEPFFLLWMSIAVYWTLRSLLKPALRFFLLAGLFFGLAYLTRIEIAPLPFVACALVLAFARRKDLIATAARASALLLVFAVVAAPYVTYLHHETGQWRLEGKSTLNLVTAQRQFVQGMNEYQAQYEVADDLTERGVWLTAAGDTIRSKEVSTKETFGMILDRVRKGGLQMVVAALCAGFAIGSPALFALALFGLFHRPWTRRDLAIHLLLIAIVILATAPILLTNYVNDRYFLVVVPFALVWASRGIFLFSRWGQHTMTRAVGVSASPATLRSAIAVGTALVMLMLAGLGFLSVTALREFDPRSRPIVAAGNWLNDKYPGPKLIADTSSNTLAFYAQGDYMQLPYTDSATALRYFDKRGVDFIVLRSERFEIAPYLRDWVENGIPSPRARLEHSAMGRSPIRIYRWLPVGSPERHGRATPTEK